MRESLGRCGRPSPCSRCRRSRCWWSCRIIPPDDRPARTPVSSSTGPSGSSTGVCRTATSGTTSRRACTRSTRSGSLSGTLLAYGRCSSFRSSSPRSRACARRGSLVAARRPSVRSRGSSVRRASSLPTACRPRTSSSMGFRCSSSRSRCYRAMLPRFGPAGARSPSELSAAPRSCSSQRSAASGSRPRSSRSSRDAVRHWAGLRPSWRPASSSSPLLSRHSRSRERSTTLSTRRSATTPHTRHSRRWAIAHPRSFSVFA